jgi:hypothetical protein
MAKMQQDQQKLMADIKMSQDESQVRLVEAETERFAKSIELAISHADMEHKHKHDGISAALEHKDMKHRHAKEMAEFHHMKTEANKPSPAQGAQT